MLVALFVFDNLWRAAKARPGNRQSPEFGGSNMSKVARSAAMISPWLLRCRSWPPISLNWQRQTTRPNGSLLLVSKRFDYIDRTTNPSISPVEEKAAKEAAYDTLRMIFDPKALEN
jgi:hypothetical protein